jgi:G3E family GTPase
METESSSKTPVVILKGFLGSGKTTLLRSLLSQSQKKGFSVGVIVNDMSELDVDGNIIAESTIIEEGDKNFKSIHACLLSSRKGLKKLRQALANIKSNNRSDLILIEASGASHPMPLVDFFKSQADFKLTGVLNLVDSLTLANDFNDGQELIPLLQNNLETDKRDTINLMVEQILFSSHLVLTKTDRLQNSRLKAVASSLHDINPYVSIHPISWGKISIDEVLSMPTYDFHRVEQLTKELAPILKKESKDERPFDMATRVIRDDRPFHPQRLWEAYHLHLGQKIYRSKGFFWLASRDKVSLLWNQTAGSINLELVGYWRAGILEEEHNLSEEEIGLLKDMISKAPGRFGDRECNLTVIGDESQVDQFVQSLNDCFLSDHELQKWKDGVDFADPWPKNLAKLTL